MRLRKEVEFILTAAAAGATGLIGYHDTPRALAIPGEYQGATSEEALLLMKNPVAMELLRDRKDLSITIYDHGEVRRYGVVANTQPIDEQDEDNPLLLMANGLPLYTNFPIPGQPIHSQNLLPPETPIDWRFEIIFETKTVNGIKTHHFVLLDERAVYLTVLPTNSVMPNAILGRYIGGIFAPLELPDQPRFIRTNPLREKLRQPSKFYFGSRAERIR